MIDYEARLAIIRKILWDYMKRVTEICKLGHQKLQIPK